MTKLNFYSIFRTEIIVALIIFVSALITYLYIKYDQNLDSKSVKPGQTWIRLKYEKNPYEDAVYDTIKVLDTRENWSRCAYNGDTMVLTNSYITYNAVLIKTK